MMKFKLFYLYKQLSIILVCFSLLLVASCQDDDMLIPTTPKPSTASGVFINNEGGFNNANATLDYYDFTTQTLSTKVFENTNNRPLGDVLQSISIIEDKAYLVMNNSNKVEVIHVETLELIATIDSLKSPRYLLPIDDHKAYVSDLEDNAISIIDLDENRKIGSIPMPAWTEQMVKWENKVFVALPTYAHKRVTDHLYIIDSDTDQVVDSLQIGQSPSQITIDKDEKIWVMCYKTAFNSILPSLYRINPENLVIEQSFNFSEFPDALAPPKLAMNGARDSLFYSINDIFVMPIEATAVPTTPLLSSGDEHFFGFNVHPINSDIYVGQISFFDQKGLMQIYSSQAEFKVEFLTGVGPSGFYFN